MPSAVISVLYTLTAEPDAPAAKEAEAPQEDDPFASLFAKGEKK